MPLIASFSSLLVLDGLDVVALDAAEHLAEEAQVVDRAAAARRSGGRRPRRSAGSRRRQSSAERHETACWNLFAIVVTFARGEGASYGMYAWPRPRMRLGRYPLQRIERFPVASSAQSIDPDSPLSTRLRLHVQSGLRHAPFRPPGAAVPRCRRTGSCIGLPVVENQEVSEAAQPVGVDHAPVGHRAHRFTCNSADEEPLPGGARLPRAARRSGSRARRAPGACRRPFSVAKAFARERGVGDLVDGAALGLRRLPAGFAASARAISSTSFASRASSRLRRPISRRPLAISPARRFDHGGARRALVLELARLARLLGLVRGERLAPRRAPRAASAGERPRALRAARAISPARARWM